MLLTLYRNLEKLNHRDAVKRTAKCTVIINRIIVLYYYCMCVPCNANK